MHNVINLISGDLYSESFNSKLGGSIDRYENNYKKL